MPSGKDTAMRYGVDLSKFENLNSFDSASILQAFHEYQALFDGPPKRYPEAMRMAGALFVIESDETIRSCANKLQVREVTLRNWVDTHGQLPVQRLAVASANSHCAHQAEPAKIGSKSSASSGGNITVELPNGCKITAIGEMADVLIDKLLNQKGF